MGRPRRVPQEIRMKSARSLSRICRSAAPLLILAAWGCGDASATSPDGGPREEEPTPPVVATVTVSADIGPNVAPGATARMTAVARDAAGNSVTASFTWSSSDPSVARVADDGTVSALEPGDVRITASVGAVSGESSLAVLDVDAASAAAVLEDAMADVLLVALGTDREAAVRPAWDACQGALDSGDLTALSGCVAPLSTALADGDRDSAPLRAVLGLFVDALDRILDLD